MIKVLEIDYLNDKYINRLFIKNMNLEEKIYFSKQDIYYFGNYDEEKLKIIKEKLIKNRKNLIKAIEKGVKFIICGNSYELFNNYFKTDELNIFTVYNPRMFKHRMNKLLVKKDHYDQSLKTIEDLSKVIEAANFRYKNMLCIKDSKLIDKIIKKQSKITLSC